ncbi:MAG: DUF2188 domain-containing protein [Syntrophorhabdaceae bacterium]
MDNSREIIKTDGRWTNRLQYGDGPRSTHRTQGEAIEAARRMLQEEGGTTLIIRDETGKFTARIRY